MASAARQAGCRGSARREERVAAAAAAMLNVAALGDEHQAARRASAWPRQSPRPICTGGASPSRSDLARDSRRRARRRSRPNSKRIFPPSDAVRRACSTGVASGATSAAFGVDSDRLRWRCLHAQRPGDVQASAVGKPVSDSGADQGLAARCPSSTSAGTVLRRASQSCAQLSIRIDPRNSRRTIFRGTWR